MFNIAWFLESYFKLQKVQEIRSFYETVQLTEGKFQNLVQTWRIETKCLKETLPDVDQGNFTNLILLCRQFLKIYRFEGIFVNSKSFKGQFKVKILYLDVFLMVNANQKIIIITLEHSSKILKKKNRVKSNVNNHQNLHTHILEQQLTMLNAVFSSAVREESKNKPYIEFDT